MAIKFRRERQCPVTLGFTLQGKCKVIYCGQWSCSRCSKLLARRWARRVLLHLRKTTADDGMQWYMLTVTLGSAELDVSRAYQKLKKLWNRLRMSITRQVKIKWQYCAFVEGQPHRQSMPHLHVILNLIPPDCYGKKGKVTQHAVHNFAHALGWGFEANFQAVTDDRASFYVAKYVSKGSRAIPRGFRRVRVSRQWATVPRDPLKKLIVRAYGETLDCYLLRVENLTNTDIQDLLAEYNTAIYDLGAQQINAK